MNLDVRITITSPLQDNLHHVLTAPRPLSTDDIELMVLADVMDCLIPQHYDVDGEDIILYYYCSKYKPFDFIIRRNLSNEYEWEEMCLEEKLSIARDCWEETLFEDVIKVTVEL